MTTWHFDFKYCEGQIPGTEVVLHGIFVVSGFPGDGTFQPCAAFSTPAKALDYARGLLASMFPGDLIILKLG